MTQELVKVDSEELIQSGIPKGLPKRKAPLWIDGYNVVFRDKSVKKAPGWAAPLTKPASNPVRGMGQLVDSGVKYLYWGDQTKLWRWATGTPTELASGFTGISNATSTALATQWCMESWGTWMIMTNGVDAIQLDKTGTTASLTGTPPSRAEIIVRFNALAVAFNTDLGGAWMEWCDTDDVEDWVNDAAGNLYIRDLDSAIRAAVRLGDYIAVLSNNALVLVTYLGAPLYLGARLALKGIGAVGKKAVVEHGREIYGLGDKGFWKSDGASFQYIDDPDVRSWLKANLNVAQKSKVCARVNEELSLIEWSIPMSSGENEVVLGYDYERKTWTFRNFGRTSFIERDVFDNPLSATATGDIFYDNFGVNANGSALVSFLQSRPFDAGVQNRYKYIDALQTTMSDLAGTGVKVYVGISEHLDDAITWSDAFTADDDLVQHNTRGLPEGRFIHFKLYSDAVGDNWTLSEFYLLGELTGEQL